MDVMTTITLEHAAGRREWLSLIVLTLAVVLLAVDGTVLVLAIPAMTPTSCSPRRRCCGRRHLFVHDRRDMLVTMGNLATGSDARSCC
ncbi:hypothetical protein [Nonomuraea rubra]|uniref:hypothetical protein n=1 Tax=Nonomuraea rubra TaxID=46180 RepID=UPI0031EB99C7